MRRSTSLKRLTREPVAWSNYVTSAGCPKKRRLKYWTFLWPRSNAIGPSPGHGCTGDYAKFLTIERPIFHESLARQRLVRTRRDGIRRHSRSGTQARRDTDRKQGRRAQLLRHTINSGEIPIQTAAPFHARLGSRGRRRRGQRRSDRPQNRPPRPGDG